MQRWTPLTELPRVVVEPAPPVFGMVKDAGSVASARTATSGFGAEIGTVLVAFRIAERGRGTLGNAT